MKNSDFRTRNTSLYGTQPSSVVFACKTATFGPELQVSMGPRPHLSFCARKTVWLSPELLGSMGPSPHLWFCECKTATLGPELLVSIGPSPHLWICSCKTACLPPELIVSIGPRSPSMDLCKQNKVLSTKITSLYEVAALFCGFLHAKQRL